MRTQVIIGAVFACAGILAPMAHGQPYPRMDERTQDLLNRSTIYSDRFERSLGQALRNSSYRGSRYASRLDDWAKYMHKELKDAADKYREHGPYAVSPGTHVQNALVAAQGINRAMVGYAFPRIAEQDWVDLRKNLNELAAVWNRPPIPEIGPAYVPAARVHPLGAAESTVLLDNIHSAAARFKDRFDHASGQYRAISRNSDFYKGIAKGLEDTTGRAAKDFRRNDMEKFRRNLQDTFVLAAAMNRTMMTNEFTPVLEAQWDSLRMNLNTLAGAYGFPLLEVGYGQMHVTD